MVPQRDEDRTRGLLSDLCSLISQQINVPVVPHRAPSPEALANALHSGRAHVAWTGAILMLLSERMSDMVPLVSAVRAGAAFYHSVLFATHDSPVRSIAGAKGKRIAWVSQSSASGYVVPRLALARAGVPVRSYFSEEIFAGSHASVTRAAVRGEVDLAATYAIFEDGDPNKPMVRSGMSTFDPELKVRVLDVSGPIPADLIVASPKLPADIRFALGNAFMRIAGDRASKEIMSDLVGADGFARFTPAILREMKTLVSAARDASAVG
jgi:phosphonate transport system substrate-binding protein